MQAIKEKISDLKEIRRAKAEAKEEEKVRSIFFQLYKNHISFCNNLRIYNMNWTTS